MSPQSAPRPCAGGCGQYGHFDRGRCPECSTKVEQSRGSAWSRGYRGRWEDFRPRFIAMLVAAGIAPVCGATLPGGPVTTDSRCQAEGISTFQSADGTDLHHDHEPPLQPWEREIDSAVCDPLRIQLLCKSCHSAKTLKETQRG